MLAVSWRRWLTVADRGMWLGGGVGWGQVEGTAAIADGGGRVAGWCWHVGGTNGGGWQGRFLWQVGGTARTYDA